MMKHMDKENDLDELPEGIEKETVLFAKLVEILTQNAVIMLGGMTDRHGRQMPPDLRGAELIIDILSVLKAKTKGNLNRDEDKMLGNTLYQLQTAFAEVASKSGDFGRARKAAEAADSPAAEKPPAKAARPSATAPAAAKSAPSPAGEAQPPPQGISPSATPSDESKVKYSKKYG
jgi:hypothetical protein